MKTVSVSLLEKGAIAQADYYSEKGELLLSRGVQIADHHFDSFMRRNIFDLYIRPQNEDDELRSLMTKEFATLSSIDLDENPEQEDQPSATNFPWAKSSLKRLMQSEKALALDKQLGKIPDRPVGMALKKKLTQMAVSDRTDSYKSGVTLSYDAALVEVRHILITLANGMITDGKVIKNIVERFVKIFVTDHNILLNLSVTKHAHQDYIFSHSLNVCLIAINIAAASGYNESQIVEIGIGALLHDIGMMLLPSDILTKQGRLTKHEWAEVQKHPILGLHLLEKVSSLPQSIPFITYQLHERENSTGYPKQRSSLHIHRFAKLTQIADIFEAMTAPRSYREAFTPHEAVTRLLKMSKTGLIQTDYVKAFLEYVSLFPVGSLVELNDHRIAKVIQANKNAQSKPFISILTDQYGNKLSKQNIFQEDLSKNPLLHIIKALPLNFPLAIDIMHGF